MYNVLSRDQNHQLQVKTVFFSTKAGARNGRKRERNQRAQKMMSALWSVFPAPPAA